MRFLPRQSKQVDSAPLMNGVSAATLVVGIMLLAPHGASAQSCMCAETGIEMALSEADAALLQDALDAQGENSLLESRDELDVAKLVLAAPAANEDLPWCTSQNDPQCSERPAGAVPTLVSLEASPLASLGIRVPLPTPSSIACDFAEHSCGGPRDAVRSKLERPPE